MALRGNLKDFSLPDVFQLVTLSRKTGILRIRRADGAEGSVWFRDGDVFFAQSNWHREPLGERLVSAGKITPSALSRGLEAQKAEGAGGRRLGQILVDEDYITDKVLEAFVQEQIQDTIFDLFRWDEGDFDFEALEETPAEDIGLSVSIENIVMEGSRRLEEWNRIKKKIPSMEIVFKMATAPGEGTFEISLKPVEWSLLLLVDGTRTVAELAADTNRTDFEVARVLYGLFSAGLLEVALDEEAEKLRAEQLRQAAQRAARETQAAAPAPQAQPEVAAPVAEAPAAAPHEPEMPTFLTGQAQEEPSTEDIAVFEQMMGAVLQAPATPEVAPAQPPAEEPAPVAPIEELAEEPAPVAPFEFPLTEEAPEAAPEPPVAEAEAELPEPPAAEMYVPPIEEAAVEEETLPAEPVASLGAEGLVASDFFAGAPAVAEPMSAMDVSVAPSEEPTIAELEAAALAAEPAPIEGIEVLEPGFEIREAATVEIVSEPAEEPEAEAPAWAADQEADDLSDLLSTLNEEAEEPAAVTTEEPAPAEEPETSSVISTDAFLSDFDGVGTETFSGGLAYELTALTGGGRARQNVAASPPPATHAAMHRDQLVDKGLVMKVIEGIKSL